MAPTWEDEFVEATKHIRSDIPWRESSELLRTLIRTKLLKFTDMKENPSRFFEAHRLLMAPAAGLRGPGFGIRFTVQFNLFAGSILGLGSPEQIAMLEDMQERGTLGCFGLTEKLAGVNSGLVVNTTATWSKEQQGFVLNTADRGAEKNWISQGLTADKCVVIADLVLDGKHYGPHGFLIDMRVTEGGELVDGISVTDMGDKTTGNDLDNASIHFANMLIPKSCLLSKFAEIRDNKYVQTTDERMRLEVIGQRLLTGRVCIAEAAVVFGQRLFARTKEYSDTKQCWAPGGRKPMLSDMPQLKAIYARADEEFGVLRDFTHDVEVKLSKCLSESSIPDADLVEAISVCKIKCVDTAIELCHALKQDVGSYALMDNTGFEHLDFLQCCRFAEGDARTLQQKLARDRLKAFSQSGWMEVAQSVIMSPAIARREIMLCFELAQGLARGEDPVSAWMENWEKVYALADVICERHIEVFLNPTGTSTEPELQSKL